MSNVMFGLPAGVERREEPAMFRRRLPAGIKSLGLDAAMLVSSGCSAYSLRHAGDVDGHSCNFLLLY